MRTKGKINFNFKNRIFKTNTRLRLGVYKGIECNVFK